MFTGLLRYDLKTTVSKFLCLPGFDVVKIPGNLPYFTATLLGSRQLDDNKVGNVVKWLQFSPILCKTRSLSARIVDIVAKAEQSFLEHLSTTFFGHNPSVTRLFCATTPRGGDRGSVSRGSRGSGAPPQLGVNFLNLIYTLIPATGASETWM